MSDSNPTTILVVPDDRLSQPSAPVEGFGAATQELAEHMTQVMRRAEGIGLAAPQLGLHQRALVLLADPYDPTSPVQALFNPVLKKWKGKQRNIEGCLSIPGQRVEVVRPARVVVSAQDASGQTRDWEMEGLLAACVLHEMDHLRGRLLLDHAARPLGWYLP